MARTTTDLSRFTVITPSRWAEVSLPVDLPLADLLPALVVHVGDEELEGRSVVLQRLGSKALDDEQTLAVLGVSEGETLYLRAAEDEAPPVMFDDLVDGVAAGVARPGAWSERRVRVLFRTLGVAVGLLGIGLLVQGVEAPAWQRVAVLVVTAVVAWGAAVVLSRREEPGGLPILLVTGVVAPAAVAAGVLVGAGPWEATTSLTGLPLDKVVGDAASVLGLLCVLVALSVRGCGVLVAGAAVVVAGVLGAAALAGTGLDPRESSAVVLVVGTLIGQLAATNAFRLAGIKVPVLPGRPEEIDRDVDPIPGDGLLRRSRLADRYFTALVAGQGLVLAASGLLLAGVGGWAETALVLAAGTLQLVRSRSLLGAGQRCVALGVGVLLIGAEVVAWAVSTEPDRALLIATGTVLVAALLLVGSIVMPGRPLPPHPGRAAEIAETLTALLLVPLLLAVLDLYARAGAIGS